MDRKIASLLDVNHTKALNCSSDCGLQTPLQYNECTWLTSVINALFFFCFFRSRSPKTTFVQQKTFIELLFMYLFLGGDDVQQLCEAGEEEFLGKYIFFLNVEILRFQRAYSRA